MLSYLRAITEDRDFTARYALVDGKYVINVEPLSQAIYQHKGPFAQAGQSFPPQPERPFLGLGGFLRDYLGVQPYEEAAKKMIATGQPLRNYEHPYQISVEPYDPHQKDEYVISANIEIAWHSPAVAAKYADQPQLELDQDEMEEFFRQVCATVCVAWEWTLTGRTGIHGHSYWLGSGDSDQVQRL